MQELISPESRILINKDNCFDIIRYYFSFVVVFAHYSGLTGANNFKWMTTSGEAVEGFFILSGFLVFYSFINKPNLKNYISKRIKRIFPAYFFIIILCAFVIGSFLTSLNFKEYISSIHFIKYLVANFSFLNFIEPTLPRVFLENPILAVNGSLWTMKVELLLYATVPIAFYLLKRYNKLAVIIGIFIFSFAYIETFNYLYEKNNSDIYLILRRQIGGQLIYFYAGTLILLYFEYFQKYIKYLLPIALILYIFKESNSFFSLLKPLSFATLIIGIAYNFKYLNFLRKYDNLACGIYLFHFPIIQIVVNYRIHEISYYFGLIIVIIGTITLSLFSWYLIEKPILKHKRITK